MTSMSCIFLLNLEILLGTFFECFCIFIRFIRFTHCSTNHLRVTRTVLHQRLNVRVIHDAVGKMIMQAVSQMENFTGIFSCHEWCCLSGLWALFSLNCCCFPPWLLSRAVKFQPGKKGRFELLWISKSVFSVVWLASFVCESVGMPSAAAISMLLAEQTGLLSLGPKKGLGADVGRALLTSPALSCRVGKSWTPPGSSASPFLWKQVSTTHCASAPLLLFMWQLSFRFEMRSLKKYQAVRYIFTCPHIYHCSCWSGSIYI